MFAPGHPVVPVLFHETCVSISWGQKDLKQHGFQITTFFQEPKTTQLETLYLVLLKKNVFVVKQIWHLVLNSMI